MQSFRQSLGIVGRMAGWGLVIDAGLGLLYSPLAELVLQVLYILDRLWKGGPSNDSLTAVATTTDPGTLLLALFLFGVLGLLGGALLGFLGGVTAGLLLAAGFRLAAQWLDNGSHRSRLVGISTAASTFPTLVFLTIINVPSAFGYLGEIWITVGWVMFTAVPLGIVFGATWWASNRVIAWLENQVNRP